MNSADYNHVSHGINKDKVIKCSLAWSYIRHQTKIIILKFYLPTKIYLAKKKCSLACNYLSLQTQKMQTTLHINPHNSTSFLFLFLISKNIIKEQKRGCTHLHSVFRKTHGKQKHTNALQDTRHLPSTRNPSVIL